MQELKVQSVAKSSTYDNPTPLNALSVKSPLNTPQPTERPKPPQPPDAPDASTPASELLRSEPPILQGKLAPLQSLSLLHDAEYVLNRQGQPYVILHDKGNVYAMAVYDRGFARLVRRAAAARGNILKTQEMRDYLDQVASTCEALGQVKDIWFRVAPLNDAIVLDVGDDAHTRIVVSPTGVEIVNAGSDVIFTRTQSCKPFVLPAAPGELKLLNKYMNIGPTDRVLLLGFITYTLMHPKRDGVAYLILALLGDQGSGKTFLTLLLLALIDPSILGVQTFPSNTKDLAVAVRQSHLRAFDNMRTITPAMSDTLCIAATGGIVAVRQLYTNDEVNLQVLHGALILNSISPFADQPDLAQRCLTIRTKPILEDNRQSGVDMLQQFRSELPQIFRGVLDLCSRILAHLPVAEVSYAGRMYDFSRWLAAMELADGVPDGIYQQLYVEMLQEGQLDSLLEHPLADAVFQFIREHSAGHWTGRPEDLLLKLDVLANARTKTSPDWPRNAIAMSKRLHTLKAGFRSQGVNIDFTRGKYRTIAITTTEGFTNA